VVEKRAAVGFPRKLRIGHTGRRIFCSFGLKNASCEFRRGFFDFSTIWYRVGYVAVNAPQTLKVIGSKLKVITSND